MNIYMFEVYVYSDFTLTGLLYEWRALSPMPKSPKIDEIKSTFMNFNENLKGHIYELQASFCSWASFHMGNFVEGPGCV